MGDVPPSSAPASEYASPEPPSSNYGLPPIDNQSQIHPGQGPGPANSAAFQAQYQQLYGPSPNTFSNQLDMGHAQGSTRQGPFNMSAMSNALPQTGYRPAYAAGQQQRINTGSAPNIMPQMTPFAGQPTMSHLAGQQQYYMAQHPQMHQYYNPQMSPTSQQQSQAGLSPRGNMNMGYYGNPMMMNPQNQMPAAYYYTPTGQYPSPSPISHGQMPSGQYLSPDGTTSDPRGISPSQGNDKLGPYPGFTHSDDPSGSRSNVVRGPPRKPRQSGHAIWIGNLPPQTDLMSLVQHVCKEAAGLESLFLISKSNCAFANFKDEGSCVAAQQRLHDSKFHTVRLVSRLRKSTVEGTAGQTAPTGPAATSPSAQPGPTESTSSPPLQESEPSIATSDVLAVQKSTVAVESNSQKDKFFILKSLTVEDLELSVRNGVWATQSHNEEGLNAAFKAVDNVYLVFSANKSGEYFGYARMVSPINDDPAAAIEFAPKAQTTSNLDLPKAIPTEATDTCPRGRIIDDSARGTIFWEVERDEADGPPDTPSEDSASVKSDQEGEAEGEGEGEGGTKAWGKPFKLEWLSTTRLPFYRTRGLRNPWNSNREVKIARDGTELEPSVGRRLIGLFNRVQSPAPLAMGLRPGMAMQTGYPPTMPPPFRQ
ncbi:YT521-B-like domain-containing protein [Xylariaceae sp. FL0016]|nr:YT521-B-like domain-containing protein [Xylariaceae sp. FL0016]